MNNWQRFFSWSRRIGDPLTPMCVRGPTVLRPYLVICFRTKPAVAPSRLQAKRAISRFLGSLCAGYSGVGAVTVAQGLSAKIYLFACDFADERGRGL